MGQRSQIYVRFNDNGNKKLIARYFGWNYGERMVSRARYTMEWLIEHKDYLCLPTQQNNLFRIMETNFDMIDCVSSTDIIQEYIEYQDDNDDELIDFKNMVFNSQDNNDGQLYIDVTEDGIKYAFIDPYDLHSEIMNPEEYMDWDCRTDTVPWKMNLKSKIIKVFNNNVKWIQNNAKLMTGEELKEFKEYDYSWQLPEKIRDKQNNLMEGKKCIEITVEKRLRLCKTFEATKEQIKDLERGINPFEDEFSDEEMEHGDIEYDYAVTDENGRAIVDWD